MKEARAYCIFDEGCPVLYYTTTPGFLKPKRLAPDMATAWGHRLASRVFDTKIVEGKKYAGAHAYHVEIGDFFGLPTTLLLDLDECWHLAGQLMAQGLLGVAWECLDERVEMVTPLPVSGTDGCDGMSGYRETVKIRIAE